MRGEARVHPDPGGAQGHHGAVLRPSGFHRPRRVDGPRGRRALARLLPASVPRPDRVPRRGRGEVHRGRRRGCLRGTRRARGRSRTGGACRPSHPRRRRSLRFRHPGPDRGEHRGGPSAPQRRSSLGGGLRDGGHDEHHRAPRGCRSRDGRRRGGADPRGDRRLDRLRRSSDRSQPRARPRPFGLGGRSNRSPAWPTSATARPSWVESSSCRS